ncbi:protein kintoun-like [Cheilinus undulatus]|uniref:protein kintoun-like n=1 Tax=Cheilinus undulatus TaxID=241271 RepID=UPI001BD4369C|nr:protein kintoun-like [Cheilinus undulatus]
MEVVDKLKELSMTAEEIDRMTKAFKDEKFREMLLDYAEELSDPENRKRYEEEIKLLEQERGNTIEFIHPEPFRAIRTSVNGKQKCFINICSNDKVSKPECKLGMAEAGRRGQYWSLPHSLHPGRENTDGKGRRFMIYDVVFHPDTLHIASKNSRFMDMVDSTAIEGIQNTFKVTLDKNNVRELNTKYKGTPQPCVIRKPIPGFKPSEASEKPDPLAFPYPETKPTQPQTKSDATPKSFQIQPPKTKELTEPKYAVKYRSFIDLQDFRCSRDSAQSPRPKEIVVTIDLPLLKMVTDANLEVTEKHLLLESQKPAYRLELPLAYPVDVDKGEAKFNKQKKQLIVTLPVLPSEEALEFVLGVNKCGVSDGEEVEVQRREQGEEKGDEKDKVREEREKKETGEEQLKSEDEENQKGTQQHGDCEGNLQSMQRHLSEDEGNIKKASPHKHEDEENSPSMQQSKSEDEESIQKIPQNNGGNEENIQKTSQYKGVDKYNPQLMQQVESEDEKNLQNTQQHEDEDRENLHKTPQHESEDEKNLQKMEHLTKMSEGGCYSAAEKKDSGVPSFQEDKGIDCIEISSKNSHTAASPETRIQPVLNTTEDSSPKLRVETEATPVQHSSMEESRATAVGSSMPSHNKNLSVNPTSQRDEESSEMPTTDEAKQPSGSGNGVSLSSVRLPTGSVQNEEIIDEDDLPTEELLGKPEHKDSRPLLPSVLLREIDEDGNEKVISDHSVSAGFIFENSLMFELD